MKPGIYKSQILRTITLPLLMLVFSACHRQDLVLEQIPLNTPPGSEIYVTGNFNNWDPGDSRYRMQRDSAGNYRISLPRGVGRLEYKFTRGDWTTVEKNECGYDVSNRSLTYGENETVSNRVASWGDTEPMNCIQKTIVISHLPDNTPENAEIFFASDINHWNPGDAFFILQKNKDGNHYITLDKMAECIYFKFTLGDWETVETSPTVKDIENRKICFSNADTVYLKVDTWKSVKVKRSQSVLLIIDKLPEGTSDNDPVYIAGSFNNWDPGHKSYRFKTDEKGRRYLNLRTDQESITFKLTRGNWRTVETTLSGKDIPDRSFLTGQSDTLLLRVDRWKDR